jgi:hypothetical protein
MIDIPNHAAIFTTGPSFVPEITTVRWEIEAMVSVARKMITSEERNPV